MKRLIILLFLILLFAFVSCDSKTLDSTTDNKNNEPPVFYTSNSTENTEVCLNYMKRYKLYIYGEYVGEKENFFFDDDDVALAFMEILEIAGASFSKTENDTYLMKLNEESYLLNVENVTLIKESDGRNYLMPPPGGVSMAKTVDSELYISSSRMQGFFDLAKINLRVIVNKTDGSVSIESKNK